MSERKIENVINDMLKHDAQKHALDFVAHLRASEAPESLSITKNNENDESLWLVKCKDKSVCVIFINGSDDFPGPWTVWIDGDYIGEHADSPVDEYVKEAAWANVAPCGSCGGDCSPGSRRTVFGKAFENVCNSTLMFANPDIETLDCMKKIADVRKNDILVNH